MTNEMVRKSRATFIPLRLVADGSKQGRREYKVTFIQAGQVRRRDGTHADWVIPAETLRKAVNKLRAVAVFVDHADCSEHPSLRNLAGVTVEPLFNEESGCIEGKIRLYDSSTLAWLQLLLDQVVQDRQEGRETPDVGLSLVFFGEYEWQGTEEQPYRVTTEITHVESCDLVFGPGAEGRVREILSAAGVGAKSSKSVGGLGIVRKPLISENGGCKKMNVLTKKSGKTAKRLNQIEEQLGKVLSMLGTQEDGNVVTGMGIAPNDRRLNLSSPVGEMFTQKDHIEAAYEQLMGMDPGHTVHRLSGIRELYMTVTGDRNFHGLIDTNLVPQSLAYSPVGNNADSTTMAELTRNVMNKALVQQADLLVEYQWWRKIARVENFNSLQQVSWVKYGGIGYDTGAGLPVISEKGEYPQLLWEDDRTTANWSKHGGYLPLSMEMIDRDDTQGWRDVPRQLATASMVGLSSVVSALFTDNSGAGSNLADGVGNGFAFNSTRGNLLTLPLDYTNWNTSIDTMYKMTQLKNATQTENRRIAARPGFLLVPIELEGQGVSVVTSIAKPGTPNNDRVPNKRILPEENVVTVPHWTDANDWAAVADPRLLPFVGVGFRFGETPEIFQPSQNNHILWLHDVLPIKVRWFYAVSVIETRGAIKSNNV